MLEVRSVGAPAKAEGHEWHKWHKGRCIVGANLKVGMTIGVCANLTTPIAPQTTQTPWGFSPQAERLLKQSAPPLSLVQELNDGTNIQPKNAFVKSFG